MKSIWVLNPFPTCDMKYIWNCIQTGLENLSQNDKYNIKSGRTLSYYIENKTKISFIAHELTRDGVSSEIEIHFNWFFNHFLTIPPIQIEILDWDCQLKSSLIVIEIHRWIKKKELLHSHHDNLKICLFLKNRKSLPQLKKFFVLFCESDIFFWSIKNQTFQCEKN